MPTYKHATEAKLDALALTTRTRARNAVRRAAGGRVRAVDLPADLAWANEHIQVFQDGIKYTTTFDVSRYKGAGTGQWYVNSVVGLDTNVGTPGAPFRTLVKAMTSAAAGDTIIIQGTGLLHRDYGPNGSRLRKSLNIVAENPGQLALSYSAVLTYTKTAGYNRVYQAARSNATHVVEWDRFAEIDGYGYRKLTTLAAVDATPGSWYSDGTTVYINTLAGTAPDNATLAVLLNGEFIYADTNNGDVSLYMEGLTILGGQGMFLDETTGVLDFYAKGCRFLWNSSQTGSSANAVNVAGARRVFLQDCTAANSQRDGFNYAAYNAAGTLKHAPQFIEVNCHSYNHGLIGNPFGAGVNNATTGHTGTQGVRVGGVYHDTDGAVVADVQENTRTANYSCTAYDSRATDTNYRTAFAAQQAGATMWLYDCVGFGADWGLYPITGATIIADGCEVDSTNGGGTLTITNPA